MSQEKAKKPRQKTVWYIYKKVVGIPWPGDFWDGFKSERRAREEMATYYPGNDFRLIRVVMTEEGAGDE